MFDPNDEQELETRRLQKGKPYFFIAAIVSANNFKPASKEEANDYDEENLMLDTLDIFEGRKKQTSDYHGMFDRTFLNNWMTNFKNTQETGNLKNLIIIMKIAKYH